MRSKRSKANGAPELTYTEALILTIIVKNPGTYCAAIDAAFADLWRQGKLLHRPAESYSKTVSYLVDLGLIYGLRAEVEKGAGHRGQPPKMLYCTRSGKMASEIFWRITDQMLSVTPVALG